jgi:hypothetical protein
VTGQDYVVKVRRLDEQLDSAGIKLGEADAEIRQALESKLEDLTWQVEELKEKAGAVTANDRLDFTIDSTEVRALDRVGAALAALMVELDSHLSDAQKAAATKYAVSTQVGMQDLYASEDQYRAAITKAVAALQPTVSDLAQVTPAEADALARIMAVQGKPGIPWKPVLLAGGALLVLWAGLKSRRWAGRRAATPPLQKLPRILRGKIRGILKFGGA